MALVRFGDKHIIQRGRRLVLPNSLLQNIGAQEGDHIELFFDTEEKAIVVKKSQTVPQGGRGQRSRRQGHNQT